MVMGAEVVEVEEFCSVVFASITKMKYLKHIRANAFTFKWNIRKSIPVYQHLSETINVCSMCVFERNHAISNN